MAWGLGAGVWVFGVGRGSAGHDHDHTVQRMNLWDSESAQREMPSGGEYGSLSIQNGLHNRPAPLLRALREARELAPPPLPLMRRVLQSIVCH